MRHQPHVASPNLISALAQQFEDSILQSRRDLSDRSYLHPDFVADGLEAIDQKSARLCGPLAGQLFPHLVAQGLTIGSTQRREVAAAWLALYGYICLVDYKLDRFGVLDARTSMSASALLGWGVATLTRLTANSRQANFCIENIHRALSAQYLDLENRKKEQCDRRKTDSDKNRAVLAPISAYCALAKLEDSSLLSAAELLLAPFQILDDLQDLEEDLEENNLTIFVRIVRQAKLQTEQIARPEAYRLVFLSHRTIEVLLEVVSAVEQAAMLLDRRRDISILDYLLNLRTQTLALINLLRGYQESPSIISEPELLEKMRTIVCNS